MAPTDDAILARVKNEKNQGQIGGINAVIEHIGVRCSTI
jgi:hypothetical protein